MKPQVEITKEGETYRVKLTTPFGTHEWVNQSEFALKLLVSLIKQRFPKAVFLHKTHSVEEEKTSLGGK